MTTDDSDQSLLARSRDGDTEAFRELFERKHRRVYLIAYQVLGEAGLAEDVVQEVFLRLWEHSARYDSRFSLDAWLRRIATNRAIDHWRVRGRERKRGLGGGMSASLAEASAAGEATSGDRAATNPEARFGWQQLQAIWEELADELPPQQRAAFVLRHIEGVEAAEVAEILQCSLSTVRSHVSEARSKLKRALRANYPELVED